MSMTTHTPSTALTPLSPPPPSLQDYGVFISFYGGLGGLAHLAQLGLPEGSKPGEVYSVGQVRGGGSTGAGPPSGRLSNL